METVEEHKVHAGKDVETWYYVVVAGRPCFLLDQLHSTMRIVQDELVSKDIDSHNFAAATAYKDKRLSLSWLDGEMQTAEAEPRAKRGKDFFMIHFRRDPNHQKPVVKRINTWWHLDDEEQDLASMLIYSDANEISENTKSVPALIPEEQAVSMLSSTRNAVSGMRSLIDKVNSLVVDLMDFQ
ncbi:hypothetical protein SELMODRAFT_427829 [Selaginella moellendorffii]|uniref:Uncharacterized protein n=1 Tax=Selaginella moellendorffii TaxID=88036 RepID=D8T0U6_SELML|nr:hypothetical protein SELMODRAFT_427829 [Selaginella moellendorffii]